MSMVRTLLSWLGALMESLASTRSAPKLASVRTSSSGAIRSFADEAKCGRPLIGVGPATIWPDLTM